MDETPAPVLSSWVGDDPPGVAFTYAPGRSGQHADTILKGFSGTLQVDGYAGYNRLLKRPAQDVTLAYCWAHARRKLHDVTQSGTAPTHGRNNQSPSLTLSSFGSPNTAPASRRNRRPVKP